MTDSRTPTAHTHAISGVTGLQGALDAKAPLASPAITGTPTVPTAAPGTNTTQIANTAFVRAALDNLLAGAPGALDTLNELAAAIGDDADFAGTITAALSLKASSADLATVATSGGYSDLSGKPSIPSGDLADLDEATAAQIRGLSTSALGITTRRARDAAALITPSGASNWTPDWSAFVSADWNVTANRTINNPTNVIPGTTRVIKIRANTGTERAISWGSNFKGNIPTAPVTNAAFLFVTLTAISSTEIIVSHLVYD
ncbi:hypothetical protein JQX10_13160 [Sulfitobacter pseudonitzschiae]|nr:hypothetical protein [Pseudosulfitobacter pseudonitzschiae]